MLIRLPKVNQKRRAEEVAEGPHDQKEPHSSGGKRGCKRCADQAETLCGSD